MTRLQNYWPHQSQVDECILTEAESLTDSLLLAVHEPMQLNKREFHSGRVMPVGEQDLLKFLLEHNRPLPLIGASGIGKSHLIRWVHAQLKRHPDRENYHIIRVPKNASLPQVLNSILDGLEGPDYHRIRDKVQGAGQTLKVHNVAEHIALKLRQALTDEYAEAEHRLRMNQQGKLTLSASEHTYLKGVFRHAGPNALPALFFDSHLTKYFTQPGTCLYNIAERLCRGASNEEIARRDYQMSGDDFAIQVDLAAVSLGARTYLQNQQILTNSDSRNIAASVVNTVMAKANEATFVELFNFNRTSFQDLMRQIRGQLLEENRCLILLIEDLATTSAIEDVLIDCLLEEDIYEGKQVLCELKSVIAVTEGYAGYQRRRDTLCTRGLFEWVISARSDNEQETKSRIVDFCGRYLNAARHGLDALERQASRFDPATPDSWLSVWHDFAVQESEDRARLDSFGYSNNDYALFPYNRAAIHQLVERHCRRQDQELVYVPRDIINFILRNPLKAGRQAYLDGHFPNTSFADVKCNFELSTRIQELGVSDAERVGNLLALWGGNGKALDELDSHICTEFELPQASVFFDNYKNGTSPSDNVRPKKKPGGKTTGEPSPSSKPADGSTPNIVRPLEPAEISKWRQTLEKWHQGEVLSQKDALKIRQWIFNGLNARIEWSLELCQPKAWFVSTPAIYARIYLPKAQAGNRGEPLVNFEAMNSDLISAVMAMAAYDHYGKWDYPNCELDYAVYQRFFDLIIPSVKQKVLEEERNDLPGIIRNLQLSSSFLGIKDTTSSDQVVQLNGLLAVPVPDSVSIPLLDDYLQEACNQIIEEHEKQRSELLRLSAAKKTGAEPYAIDGRLILAFAKLASQYSSGKPNKIDEVFGKINTYRKQLLPIQKKVHDNFGLLGDVSDDIAESLRELIVLAQKEDIARPHGIALELTALVNSWNTLELKSIVKLLAKLSLPQDNDIDLLREVMSINGLHLKQLQLLLLKFDDFEEKTVAFLTRVTNSQQGSEIVQAETDVITQVDRLDQKLQQLEECL